METVVDDDMWNRLAERCWAAPQGTERRDAIGVLTELLDWHPRTLEAITTRVGLLGRWLETTEAAPATNFCWLLNNVSLKEARDVVEEICDRADPAVLAASIAKATWSEAYAWGDFARQAVDGPRRLAEASAIRARCVRVQSLVAGVTPANLYQFDQLLDGLRALDKALALQLTEVFCRSSPKRLTTTQPVPSMTFTK